MSKRMYYKNMMHSLVEVLLAGGKVSIFSSTHTTICVFFERVPLPTIDDPPLYIYRAWDYSERYIDAINIKYTMGAFIDLFDRIEVRDGSNCIVLQSERARTSFRVPDGPWSPPTLHLI